MKLTSLFTFGLIPLALASPTLTERDSPASSVVAAIGSQVPALSSAVSAYDGSDFKPIQDASDAITSTINQGAVAVQNGPSISNSDALALTGPVQDLIDQINSIMSELIGKKDLVVKGCDVAHIKKALNDQYTASGNLADSITAKVPEALSEIAGELSGGISSAIKKGIDAYAGLSDSCSSTTAPTATETATEPSVTQSSSSTPVIPTSGATGGSIPSASGPSTPEFTGGAIKERGGAIGIQLGAAAIIAIWAL
ncbi:hydrophobic surface binding protein A-domain-containing protein [Aspergillus insuetus]